MIGFNKTDENFIQFLQKQSQQDILKLDKKYNKVLDRIYSFNDFILNKDTEIMVPIPEYTNIIFNFKIKPIPKWYQLYILEDSAILYISDNVKQIYNFSLLAYNILNQQYNIDDIFLKKYFEK